MSDERIDHAAVARQLLSRSLQWSEPDAAEIGADIAALTNATLALVEQQRIANLIALGAQREEISKIDETLSDAALKAMLSDAETVRPEIREALGL